jgi:hypothetical protein
LQDIAALAVKNGIVTWETHASHIFSPVGCQHIFGQNEDGKKGVPVVTIVVETITHSR